MKYTLRNKLKIGLAVVFGAIAHIKQRRKYTGQFYITHPIAVARLVASVTHDVNMLCAAILHDTIEDTWVQEKHLRFLFGDDVTQLVLELTDVAVSDGLPPDKTKTNRAVRTKVNREHTGGGSARSKTIKLADLIHNTDCIVAHDPNFAIVYLKEKELLMDVLHEGSPILFELAGDRLIQGKLSLLELK